MSFSGKRKAQNGDRSSVVTSSLPGPSTKRVRIDVPNEEEDYFDGDPELEEEDRKRDRRKQKAGMGADEVDSESSDEEDADGATYRRKAEKSRGNVADEDEDMFDLADEESPRPDRKGKNKSKDQDFLKLGELEEGQEFDSRRRSGLDEDDADVLGGDADDIDPDLEFEDSSEDEDETDLDLNAEGERTPPTSPGGTPLTAEDAQSGKSRLRSKMKKKKGPQITGFNMKEEMRTGKFDQEGNYHENSRDPHAQHDVWLAGVYSKKKIKEARQAQEKRDREAREKAMKAEQEDNDEDDIKKRLVEYMMRGETVARTLQRLGKEAKSSKDGNASRARQRSKEKKEESNMVGTEAAQEGQAARDVEAVTHLASVLMSRFGILTIYDKTYESLLQDVLKSGLVRRTFDPASRFDEPISPADDTIRHDTVDQSLTHIKDGAAGAAQTNSGSLEKQLEYKWSPTYLAEAARASGEQVAPEVEVFGPFPASDLKSWADEGYFGAQGERILVREAGSKEWRPYSDLLS